MNVLYFSTLRFFCHTPNGRRYILLEYQVVVFGVGDNPVVIFRAWKWGWRCLVVEDGSPGIDMSRF